MKKKLLYLLWALTALCAIGLFGCGGQHNDSPPVTPDGNSTITGITFQSQTYTYDGTEKTLLITGNLPDGVDVVYAGNKGTNANVYNASAVLSGENYQTLTLTATLTINKANFDVDNVKWNYSSAFTYDGTEKTVTLSGLPSGLSVKKYTDNAKTDANNYTASATFNYDEANYNAPNIPSCQWTIDKATMTDITFSPSIIEYDTLEHSIFVSGNVPVNATVKYICNGQERNTFTEVGSYEIAATVSAPNYYDFTTSATLTIKSTEMLLYSVNNNGTIYFQNNLDDDKLYKVTSMGISKVNNDNVSHMIANDGTIYYFSSCLFGLTIKQLKDAAPTTIVSANGGEFITTDGTYLYYAINHLFLNTEENGIYKIKLDTDDETPTRICTNKAKYLTYVNGYIYYSNTDDSDRLYKVSVSSTDASGSLVWEERTSYIIADGNCLYFNSSKTIASAIYKHITTSGETVKLTIDSGKYLTKIGDYIYYVNNDLLTSTLFGDGIYRTSALMATDNNQPGEKLLSATDNGYSSLASDGKLLYYYKLNDKRFYSYDVDSKTETDLMKNFVVTDDTNLTGYVSLAEHKGEIYYTNVLDNGYLYKYNPTTKAKFKVIDKSVSTVSFYRDYMYYSTYVVGNYAMFRRDMITGETLKISSSRLDHLIFDGETVYCIKVGSVYNNHIHKMDLDGNNFEKIFSTSLWVSDFYKEGDYIYCVANTPLGKDYVYKFDVTANEATSFGFKSKAFTVYNGIIYYYDHTDDKLYSYDGTTKTVIAQNVTVNDLIVHDGKLYYSAYGDTTGFYAYDLTAKTKKKISDKNADGLTIYNDNIYFVQTAISFISDKAICGGNSSNDGRLYYYDGNSIIKAA